MQVLFNIATLLGAQQKPPELLLSPTPAVPKVTCEAPAPAPIQLEIFSVLGFTPASNPFAAKQPIPAQCPEPPQPLT